MGKGSRAGARNIAPLIRGSFIQAIEQLKKAGTIAGMADIWQDIIATDPARALELLSKYVPKEMLIEVEDGRPWAFMAQPLTPEQWRELYAKPHGDQPPATPPH